MAEGRKKGDEEQTSDSGLPAASLEKGAGASKFVDMPDKPDESLRDFLSGWPGNYDPRAKMR